MKTIITILASEGDAKLSIAYDGTAINSIKVLEATIEWLKTVS